MANERQRRRYYPLAALGVWLLTILACSVQGPRSGELHRWWAGLGPVLPHDSFPADCTLCHVGDSWNDLVPEFEFDHEARTGIALRGAHQQATCLRCHNDRGPVSVFAARGCAGCHEDVHFGELGQNCTECHGETTWSAVAQIERHDRTRFPLVGAHRATACHRCHPGAAVGNFQPTDNECVSCHLADLARAINPPHQGLGWVDRCDRCHIPTRWPQARIR